MYDNPDRRTYTFAAYDYGGAAGARVDKIRGPNGKKGKLVDYGVMSIQEAFAGTVSANIAVGNAADPDAHGEEFALNGAAVADGGYTVRSVNDVIADKAAFDALMVDVELPADTAVYITSTEGSGGGETGQGTPYVVVDWDW